MSPSPDVDSPGSGNFGMSRVALGSAKGRGGRKVFSSLPPKPPPPPKKKRGTWSIPKEWSREETIGEDDIVPYGPFPEPAETQEELIEKEKGMAQTGLSQEDLASLEEKVGPLKSRALGRGRTGFSFSQSGFTTNSVLDLKGYKRKETPHEALNRKNEECFVAPWFMPGEKDFYSIDTLSYTVQLPYGVIPTPERGQASFHSKGQINTQLTKWDGLPKGVYGELEVNQFQSTLPDIGKNQLKKGVTKASQILDLVAMQIETGITTPDKNCAREYLNAPVLSKVEIKQDVEIDEASLIYLKLIAAMPFLFPRIKSLTTYTSTADERHTSVYSKNSSPKRGRTGKVYIPRNGITFYVIPEPASPGKVFLRAEVQKVEASRVFSVLNKCCPLPHGKKRKRAYVEDILVSGAPTAFFSHVFGEVLDRIRKAMPKGKIYRKCKGFKEIDFSLPEDMNSFSVEGFSEMVWKSWEKVEEKVKSISAVDKYRSSARMRYLKKYLYLLNERGLDLLGFMSQFLPSANSGYRNGYCKMERAEVVASANETKFPEFLSSQNMSLRAVMETGNSRPSNNDYPYQIDTLDQPETSKNSLPKGKVRYRLENRTPENGGTPTGSRGRPGKSPNRTLGNEHESPRRGKQQHSRGRRGEKTGRDGRDEIPDRLGT